MEQWKREIFNCISLSWFNSLPTTRYLDIYLAILYIARLDMSTQVNDLYLEEKCKDRHIF